MARKTTWVRRPTRPAPRKGRALGAGKDKQRAAARRARSLGGRLFLFVHAPRAAPRGLSGRPPRGPRRGWVSLARHRRVWAVSARPGAGPSTRRAHPTHAPPHRDRRLRASGAYFVHSPPPQGWTQRQAARLGVRACTHPAADPDTLSTQRTRAKADAIPEVSPLGEPDRCGAPLCGGAQRNSCGGKSPKRRSHSLSSRFSKNACPGTPAATAPPCRSRGVRCFQSGNHNPHRTGFGNFARLARHSPRLCSGACRDGHGRLR